MDNGSDFAARIALDDRKAAAVEPALSGAITPRHESQFSIPTRAEVPFEVRQAILEEKISVDQASVRRAGEDAKLIKSIADERRHRTVSLIGPEKYERFRGYIADQKRAKARLLLPPRGPEMSREEVERFRAERREESQVALRAIGVSVDQLRLLREKTTTALTKLAMERPVLDGRHISILLPAEVPQPIRTGQTGSWRFFRPPYDGWSWWIDGSMAGFTFTPTLFLDAGVGLVGNMSHVRDSDASDNDYAHMKYATAVSFWYQMPATGLIEVWIEGQSVASHHHLSLWDEWGWSNSSVTQQDFLTLKASVGGSASALQMAEMSWFRTSDETEGYWDNHYLTDGATYWATLRSDPSVIIPAGAWVLVEVGMLNFHSSFSNDVEVYSTMDFSWIIRNVAVRSTGN